MDKELLKKFVPFNDLQDEYLDEALGQIKVETFKKGQMLFKRGKAIAARYFLLEGRVELIDSSYVSSSVRSGSVNATGVLNPESPTRCSCIAKDPVVKAFCVDAEALDRLVAWSESAESAFEAERSEKLDADLNTGVTGQFDVVSVEEEETTDWMSALLTSPLFGKVPLTLVQDLFSRFSDLKVRKGDVIIKEGEKGDYFYVVSKGRARIRNNTNTVDVVVEAGQHFGEEALLGGTLRNATITMEQDGELKRLDAENFNSLLTEPVLQYISKENMQGLKSHKLIDVKMPLEYRAHHEKGSINLPLARLRATIPELAKTTAYVIASDAGSRAKIAAHLLCQSGFDAYILAAEEIPQSASA
jgi:CRP-like cAMP-binding protein